MWELFFFGQFSKCLIDSHNHDDGNIELPEEILELDETDNSPNEMLQFVAEGSFVGIYSSENSIESFYIVKVIEKSVAEEDICDLYGHAIQKGVDFLKCNYLEKTKENSDYISYKVHKKVVYIYPGEIFCPVVPMSNKLTLPIAEYLFLSDTLSRHL